MASALIFVTGFTCRAPCEEGEWDLLTKLDGLVQHTSQRVAFV